MTRKFFTTNDITTILLGLESLSLRTDLPVSTIADAIALKEVIGKWSSDHSDTWVANKLSDVLERIVQQNLAEREAERNHPITRPPDNQV